MHPRPPPIHPISSPYFLPSPDPYAPLAHPTASPQAWRTQPSGSKLAIEALKSRSGAATDRLMTTTDTLDATTPSGSLTARPTEDHRSEPKEAFLERMVEECTKGNSAPRTDLFAHLRG